MWVCLGQTDEILHQKSNPDWLNKVPWYNTAICTRLHVTVFEDYIRNARIDRYNLMCSITAHGKLLPTYVYYTSSGIDIAIFENATIKAARKIGRASCSLD